MTATATEPAAPPLVQVVPLYDTDRQGRPVLVPGATKIVGVPGGPPGEQGFVILRPIPGVEEREIEALKGSDGQDIYRSWRTEVHFRGSPRFPKGVELGFISRHTDTGTGTPFEESSTPQCGTDNYDRLRAFAYGQPYLGMEERREIERQTQKYLSEKNAYGEIKPGTKTPTEALEAVGDQRLQDFIQRAVKEGVDRELATRGAAAQAQSKGPTGPSK